MAKLPAQSQLKPAHHRHVSSQYLILCSHALGKVGSLSAKPAPKVHHRFPLHTTANTLTQVSQPSPTEFHSLKLMEVPDGHAGSFLC